MNLNHHINQTNLVGLPERNFPSETSSSLTTGFNEELEGKKSEKPFLHLISSATTDFNVEPKKLLEQKKSESSTTKQSYSTYLYEEAEALFESGKGQNFEDGMESEFSKKLVSFVKEYGDDAIEAITCLINYQKVNTEVATEALRWLGQIEHPTSYRFRLWLLQYNLKHPKARVRDGAILGLSFLNDPIAIPYLKLAIEQEKCRELREDMEQVLAQLERVSQCRFS